MSKKTHLPPPERIALSDRECAALVGTSTRAIWKWTADGRFPTPVRIGRTTRWLRADILAHLDALKRDERNSDR